jgi:signal transduction histidine kinase
MDPVGGPFPGIAPEDQARLFERFFVGASAETAVGGTGLGLPTALAITQAHGGRIDVDSALGQGSRFTLAVPAAGPPGADEP